MYESCDSWQRRESVCEGGIIQKTGRLQTFSRAVLVLLFEELKDSLDQGSPFLTDLGNILADTKDISDAVLVASATMRLGWDIGWGAGVLPQNSTSKSRLSWVRPPLKEETCAPLCLDNTECIADAEEQHQHDAFECSERGSYVFGRTSGEKPEGCRGEPRRFWQSWVVVQKLFVFFWTVKH